MGAEEHECFRLALKKMSYLKNSFRLALKKSVVALFLCSPFLAPPIRRGGSTVPEDTMSELELCKGRLFRVWNPRVSSKLI